MAIDPGSELFASLEDRRSKAHRQAARIRAVVEKTVARGRPIIVGPWVGEVGFELLYWVPFVRWVAQAFKIPRQRLFIVSRGGTSSWYGDISDQYLDAFSFAAPEEIAAARENTKAKQSAHYDAFLSSILEQARSGWQLTQFDRLHPHLMYRLFRPYWDGDAPLDFVEEFLRFARISTGSGGTPLQVPREYVATRVYFSRSFPDTAENREFVRQTLEAIAQRIPVVRLRNSTFLDDHGDLEFSSDRIVELEASADSSTNLEVQTEVISRATAFVGTYGGLSYLPSACGVPTIALYSRRRWRPCHLHVAESMIRRINGGPLIPVRLDRTPAEMASLALEHAMR